jgi:hypothetical protein
VGGVHVAPLALLAIVTTQLPAVFKLIAVKIQFTLFAVDVVTNILPTGVVVFTPL